MTKKHHALKLSGLKLENLKWNNQMAIILFDHSDLPSRSGSQWA